MKKAREIKETMIDVQMSDLAFEFYDRKTGQIGSSMATPSERNAVLETTCPYIITLMGKRIFMDFDSMKKLCKTAHIQFPGTPDDIKAKHLNQLLQSSQVKKKLHVISVSAENRFEQPFEEKFLLDVLPMSYTQERAEREVT